MNTWNKLPSSVVEAPTLNSFKARLDRHFHNEITSAHAQSKNQEAAPREERENLLG